MTSTVEAIRDRIIAVIEALTPAADSRVRFRAFRPEAGQDFQDWAEANPTAARRRFYVREVGTDQEPPVSDTLAELRTVTFTILVAYPRTSRDGTAQPDSRDAVIDADRGQIQDHVGQHGRENFYPPDHDATWIGGDYARVDGVLCDFIEITQSMTYYLAV